MELKLGEEIYYTGDVANLEDAGVVVGIRPPNRWGPETYDIELDNGRLFRGVFGVAFDPGPGRRFWRLEDWEAKRRAKIAAFVDSVNRAKGEA